MTNVFLLPGLDDEPEPEIGVWIVVRGNGVIDILGWLNNFAAGFLDAVIDVFWKV